MLSVNLSKSFTLNMFTFTFNDCLIGRALPSHVNVYLYNNAQGRSLVHELQTAIFPFAISKKLIRNDLLIIATERPPVVPILLAKLLKPSLTLVWDFHGITPPSYHKDTRRLIIDLSRMSIIKWLLKHCNFRIVHSNFIKDEVRRLFNADSLVLPLGVDLERFYPLSSADSAKANSGNKFTLLYVGRLVPHKRVDFIIKAIATLNDPSVQLLIAGSGEEKGNLESLVKSLGLSAQVVFLGKISDEELPKLYQNSDVFVTASLHEGVCLPILESFATGVPVIIPNNTAMIETAEDGCLIYDEKSVKDLGQKILLMKSDTSLRLTLSERALEIAFQHSPEKLLRNYERLIKRIMADFP